ncbi:unnamed protein product [Closterium sp. NIES-64]|nr:unnamed protein product [Closterium sp. NIES-64]
MRQDASQHTAPFRHLLPPIFPLSPFPSPPSLSPPFAFLPRQPLRFSALPCRVQTARGTTRHSAQSQGAAAVQPAAESQANTSSTRLPPPSFFPLPLPILPPSPSFPPMPDIARNHETSHAITRAMIGVVFTTRYGINRAPHLTSPSSPPLTIPSLCFSPSGVEFTRGRRQGVQADWPCARASSLDTLQPPFASPPSLLSPSPHQELLEEDARVFKLIGPVLVPQDPSNPPMVQVLFFFPLLPRQELELLEEDAKVFKLIGPELELLEEDAKVFKLIGPVLVPQDLAEARANVGKRLEYISSEV